MLFLELDHFAAILAAIDPSTRLWCLPKSTQCTCSLPWNSSAETLSHVVGKLFTAPVCSAVACMDFVLVKIVLRIESPR